jgi:hypothetical protein
MTNICVFSILFGILLHFGASRYWLLLCVLPVLACFRTCGYALCPPIAVLLGMSGENTIRLAKDVRLAIAPCRLVTLLQGETSLKKGIRNQDWESGGLLNFDSLRIPRGWEWREPVRGLIALCPIVVVDLRAHTENVGAEIEELINAHALGKCLFVLDGDAGFPPGDLAIEATQWHSVAKSGAQEAPDAVLLIMGRLRASDRRSRVLS